MNDFLLQTINILKKWENKSKKILSNGTIQICHVPHVGDEAWLHKLYVGLDENQIEQLQNSIPVSLPESYKELLKHYNGLNIFSNSLCIWGYRSLNYRTGEESIQPYCLFTENLERAKNCPETWLYFGSYSWDGSKVFINTKGGFEINKVYRTNMHDVEIQNEWPDIWTWLLSETQRLSKMFDENGVEFDEDNPTTPETKVKL
jgi:hypothetical protein